MDNARIRRELGMIALSLEGLRDRVSREVYASWPATVEADRQLVASLDCAMSHLEHANKLAGKALVAELTDKDLAQAEEAGRRA